MENKVDTIVFTNGRFDGLHAGHVFLFEECKKMGGLNSEVIVGLNSDFSIKNITGEKPKVNQDHRYRILSAIKYIDKIYIFNDDTPLSLIERIRPHILVKGNDYAEKAIVGADFVKSYRGRVILVPCLKVHGYKISSNCQDASFCKI